MASRMIAFRFSLIFCRLTDGSTMARSHRIAAARRDIRFGVDSSSVVTVAVLVAVLSGKCLGDEAREPARRAVLVAVDEYENKDAQEPVAKLSEAVSDARDFGRFLEDNGFNVEYVLKEKATRESILSRIEAAGNAARQPDDVIVVGFWGHGFQPRSLGVDVDTDYDKKFVVGQVFFYPYDGKREPRRVRDGVKAQSDGLLPIGYHPEGAPQVEKGEGRSNYWVRMQYDVWPLMKSKNRFLIWDCCRTDKGKHVPRGGEAEKAERKDFEDGLTPSDKHNDYCFLAASREGEGAGDGVFTHCLLEELMTLQASQRRGEPVVEVSGRAQALEDRVGDKAIIGQVPRCKVEGSPELKLKPGDRFTNSLGMEMRRVKAGQFNMGNRDAARVRGDFSELQGEKRSVLGEKPNQKNLPKKLIVECEFPGTPVAVSEYWIGATEVTVGDFLKYYNARKQENHQFDWEGNPQDRNRIHTKEIDRELLCEGFVLAAPGQGLDKRRSPDFRPWCWCEKAMKDVGNLPLECRVATTQDENFVDQRVRSYPVVNVSWQEASDFCKWLSEEEEERNAGRRYRLPTEAQWEYACRGGTETYFWFGNDRREIVKRGNFADGAHQRCFPLATVEQVEDGFALSAPFSEPIRFERNEFGLIAMHGNVREWVNDYSQPDANILHTEYQARGFPVKDPEGPPKGIKPFEETRVIRGGSYMQPAWRCRSSYRYHAKESERFVDLGFRVVCVMEKAESISAAARGESAEASGASIRP